MIKIVLDYAFKPAYKNHYDDKDFTKIPNKKDNWNELFHFEKLEIYLNNFKRKEYSKTSEFLYQAHLFL